MKLLIYNISSVLPIRKSTSIAHYHPDHRTKFKDISCQPCLFFLSGLGTNPRSCIALSCLVSAVFFNPEQFFRLFLFSQLKKKNTDISFDKITTNQSPSDVSLLPISGHVPWAGISWRWYALWGHHLRRCIMLTHPITGYVNLEHWVKLLSVWFLYHRVTVFPF